MLFTDETGPIRVFKNVRRVYNTKNKSKRKRVYSLSSVCTAKKLISFFLQQLVWPMEKKKKRTRIRFACIVELVGRDDADGCYWPAAGIV